MDLLHDIGIGLGVALDARNLLCVLLGVVFGMLVGVLPGIAPVAAMALLLPAMLGLDPTPALVMLAAVYCGAQYGASTAAILLKLEGDAPAATAIEGCQMARQGRAGSALAVATLGSFFAGCIGTLAIALLALPAAELAFQFGPPEYFSLMVLGLVGAAAFAPGSFVKGLAMTLLGLLLAQVGTDRASGVARFTFELPQLAGGIGWVVIAIGLFGAGEIIANLGVAPARRELVVRGRVQRVRPSPSELREAWPSVLRGTALGALLGLLPGSGALLASFASYAIEKRVVERPRVPFGKGAIQGVAGPESANNAAAQASFIPMLAFGVPGNAVMALLVGVLTIKGIHPGPQVMTGQPQLFWGLIASMWLANLLLLILNLPLAGLWMRLLVVPYRLIFPAVALACGIGAYALGHRSFDVYLVAGIGFVGYCLFKLGCDAAPLLLGFIMEPMLEENLRNALLFSAGDWKILVSRPLSSGLLVAAALLIFVVALPSVRQKRELALHEE